MAPKADPKKGGKGAVPEAAPSLLDRAFPVWQDAAKDDKESPGNAMPKLTSL